MSKRIVWTDSTKLEVCSNVVEIIREDGWTPVFKPLSKWESLFAEAQQILPYELQKASFNAWNDSFKSLLSLTEKLWLESIAPVEIKEVKVEKPCLSKLGVDGFMDLFLDALTHPEYAPLIKQSVIDLLGDSFIKTGTPIVLNEQQVTQPVVKGKVLPKYLVIGLLPIQQEQIKKRFGDKAKFVFFEGHELGKIKAALKGQYTYCFFIEGFANHSCFGMAKDARLVYSGSSWSSCSVQIALKLKEEE